MEVSIGKRCTYVMGKKRCGQSEVREWGRDCRKGWGEWGKERERMREKVR